MCWHLLSEMFQHPATEILGSVLTTYSSRSRSNISTHLKQEMRCVRNLFHLSEMCGYIQFVRSNIHVSYYLDLVYKIKDFQSGLTDPSCWSHDCLVSMATSPTYCVIMWFARLTYLLCHHHGCLMLCYSFWLRNLIIKNHPLKGVLMEAICLD